MSLLSPEVSAGTQIQSVKHSIPKTTKLYPRTTGDITLSASSATDCEFVVPNLPFNAARSSLEGNLTIAATAGSKYTYCHTLGVPILQSVEVLTREGNLLVNIQNVNKFCRVVDPYVNRLENVMQMDKNLGNGTSVAAVNFVESGGFLSNSGIIGSTTVGVVTAPQRSLIPAGGATAITNVDVVGLNTFVQSAIDSALYFHFQIPLRKIYHTMLSADELRYYGSDLTFRLRFAPHNQFCWIGTSLTDVSAGAAATAAAVTISNLRLKLCGEQNEEIWKPLVARVQQQGIKYPTAYVNQFLNVSASGVQSSYVQSLHSGHGRSLLNLYSAVFHATDSLNTSMDISNGVSADAKVISFVSKMDNENRMNYTPLCASNEDYQEMKPLLEGSCIADAKSYRHHRCWIESFRAGKCVEWLDRDISEVDGLSLKSERQYAIEFNTHATPAVYRQYFWAITQRVITVSPNGMIEIA